MTVEVSAGEHYLRRTVYRSDELFAEQPVEEHPEVEPPLFKVYRGLPRHPLGTGLPLRLADARACAAGPPAPQPWDVAAVSALTYHTYGLSRRDEGPGAVWPLHRQVPSARCLFPTEIYLWIPPTGDLPGGLHHYDPLHHDLVLLRAGDLRAELSDALGARLDGCRAVVLVSSMYWKNAFKYHGYAYRLCSQEAGMVTGNCLLVAAALGLRGAVHHRFVDDGLGHLLGLDRREEGVFAAVVLRDGSGGPAPSDADDRGAREPVPAVRTSFAGMDTFGRELDPMLSAIAERSRLDRVDTGPVARRETGYCAGPAIDLPRPGGSGRDFDLAAALRARCSGNVMFHPRPESLAVADLSEILHPLLHPYDSDVRPSGARSAITVLVAAVDVDGLARGCYRYCPEHHRMHPIEVGGMDGTLRSLQGAISVPNVNLCASNAVVYLAGDVGEALRTHGDRGYRILTMEAGVVAQRLGVLAAACGLVSRVHNGYSAADVERALHTAPGLTPLFQIAVAHNRPGVQYGLRILF